MSKVEVADAARLKSYKGPWKGQLLLACGKCQKKLRDDDAGDVHGLSKLRKELRRRAKHDADPLRLIVVRTQCLKVCPKRGVAVCTQAQMAAGRGSIVRTGAEVDLLYAECKADEAFFPASLASSSSLDGRKKRRQTR